MNPEINEINLSTNDVSALVLKKIGHEHIIKQNVAPIEGHPEEEKAFIAFLFATMAVEGDASVTNMRDVALTFLADSQIQPLLKSNSGFVLATYIRSVRTQTWENDPYDGSIATLLEAGKVVASILRPDKRDLNRIKNAWQKVTQDTPEAENRKYIYKVVGEIKHAACPEGPRLSTVELDNLDNQVETLSKQGLNRNAIAQELKVSLVKISNSRSRLRKAGRVDRYQTALDNQVETLSNQGLSRKEMAGRLKVSLVKISNSRSRLRKAGRMELMKRKQTELAEFDNQVEALSKEGLSRKEMAEMLNISLSKINNSRGRLLKAGRVELMKRGRPKKVAIISS